MADNYDENTPRFPYWKKAPIDPYDSQTSRIPDEVPSLDKYDWQASKLGLEKIDELFRSYSESYSLISKAELDYERLRQLNIESSRNFDYAEMGLDAAAAALKAGATNAAIGLAAGRFGGGLNALKVDPAQAVLGSVKNSILRGYSGKGVGPKNRLPREMFVDDIREKNVREQTLDDWQHQLVANITSAVGNKYSKGIVIDVADALGVGKYVPPGIPTKISLLNRSYNGGVLNGVITDGGNDPIEKKIGDNLFTTDISTNSFARIIAHALRPILSTFDNIDISEEDSVDYHIKRVAAELGKSRSEKSIYDRSSAEERLDIHNWYLSNRWKDPRGPAADDFGDTKEYTSGTTIPLDVLLDAVGTKSRKSDVDESLKKTANLSLTPPDDDTDKITNKYSAYSNESYVPQKINERQFPFSIENISNNKTLYFPAYIRVLTETVSPSWNSMSFINRSEDFYVYQKTDRALNLEFFLFAGASGESVSSVSTQAVGYDITASREWKRDGVTDPQITNLPPVITHKKMWELINDLHGCTRPNYYHPEGEDGVHKFVTGPYLKITIGEMYKSQLAILDSITINYEPLIWNMNSEDKLAPMVANLTLGFKFMHQKVPTSNSNFYGHVNQ